MIRLLLGAVLAVVGAIAADRDRPRIVALCLCGLVILGGMP